MANGWTVFRQTGTIAATVTTPMITPTLLRARSFDEPGARIPHAGISKGTVG
jgi:hypothetical protein